MTLPKTIANALDRVKVFSKQEHTLDEEANINIKNGRMTLKARSDTGWIEEKINMKYKGDTIDFSINPTFLEEIIHLTNICKLGKSKIKFIGEDWTHTIALHERPE